MTALLKVIHIVAVALWCGGLLSLPVILRVARRHPTESDAARARIVAHHLYNSVISPAAVLAVVAGAMLVFARETYAPWFAAKLALVAALVALHAYTGHLVVKLSEEGHVRTRVPPVALLGAGAGVMAAILVVVLAKPVWGPDIMPAALRTPLDRHLPLPVVPN